MYVVHLHEAPVWRGHRKLSWQWRISLALMMPLQQRQQRRSHTHGFLTWSDDTWDIEQHSQVGEQPGESEGQNIPETKSNGDCSNSLGRREEEWGMEEMVWSVFCVTPESKILTPVGKLQGGRTFSDNYRNPKMRWATLKGNKLLVTGNVQEDDHLSRLQEGSLPHEELR